MISTTKKTASISAKDLADMQDYIDTHKDFYGMRFLVRSLALDMRHPSSPDSQAKNRRNLT